MQIEGTKNDHNETHLMEARLSKVGAKIDNVISKAIETRVLLKNEIKDLKAEGSEALHEVKDALDKAFVDLNQAWKDLKTGGERAAKKFQVVSPSVNSSGEEEYLCLTCEHSFFADSSKDVACPKCGSKHEEVFVPDDEEDAVLPLARM